MLVSASGPVEAHEIPNPLVPPGVDATLDEFGEIDTGRPAAPMVNLWGPQDPGGDTNAPMFGPGYELAAVTTRPVTVGMTFGAVRDEVESWTADRMSGLRVHLGPEAANDSHFGFAEPWGIDLPNDRGMDVGEQVPWDFGLSAPRQEGFVDRV